MQKCCHYLSYFEEILKVTLMIRNWFVNIEKVQYVIFISKTGDILFLALLSYFISVICYDKFKGPPKMMSRRKKVR